MSKLLFVYTSRREDMHFVHSSRRDSPSHLQAATFIRQDVKSFAALIRLDDENFRLPVSSSPRLHVSTTACEQILSLVCENRIINL